MLDDPTDWTARPYSTLEANLPPLFSRQLDFDQGIPGHLSTSALLAEVASLAFKKENIIKILVSSPEIPFTPPTRNGLPSPKFKSLWLDI